VYFPAYPILIRAVGIAVNDYWLAAFLLAQSFACGSIVLFQLLAEGYMTRQEALNATLLMATFPYVALFTTLSYSEPMFLFFSIGAWYFYKRKQLKTSAMFAAVASVTRIYGIAIILPMIFDIIRSGKYRRLLYLTVPVLFVGSWFMFGYLSTGNPWVSWSDERFWVFDSKYSLLQTVLRQSVRLVTGCCAVDPGILVAVGLFAVLTACVWRVDRHLWTYAIALFVSLIVTTVDHVSLLRYFSFIFPIWLIAKVKNSAIIATCLVSFIPIMLVLWTYVLSGVFIG
jgi:hypothetical protein